MDEQAEVIENEVEVEEQVEQIEGEQEVEQTDQQPQAEAEPEEVVVTIGDAQPDPEEEEYSRAPEWVNKLRKERRDLLKKVREYESREQQAAKPQAVQLGQKPTLESCDYDAEKFEAELTAWHDQKRKADEAERSQKAAEEEARKAWNAKLEAYAQQKSALKVADYEEAEAQAQEMLNVTQQGIILQGAENPAAVVYALGKNPAKAKELAAITDPVKFTFAVARLEAQVKITPRKAAPLPETKISGAGRVAASATADAKISQLHEKAQKTGDYSAYLAAKREQDARKAA